MKIIFEQFNNLYYDSISSACQMINDINVTYWNRKNKPVLDMLDEIGPDIVFSHSDMIDQAFVLGKERHNFKLVCIAGDKKHDAIDLYLSPDHEDEQTLHIQHSVNIAQIHNAKKRDHLVSDVSIITHVDLTPYSDIVNFLVNNYQVKIYGHPTRLPNYLGEINLFQKADILKSSKAIVEFEPIFYMDSLYLGGSPLIYKKPDSISEGIGFENIDELKEKLDIVLNEKQSQVNLKGKTSLSVSSNIFKLLNQTHLVDSLDAKIKEFSC